MPNKQIHVATYEETCKDLEPLLKDKGNRIVIRLGGQQPYAAYPIQINSAKAIGNSVDKLRMKILFLAHGIPTSKIADNAVFPLVVKGLKRSQGTGVAVVKNAKEMQKEIKRIDEKCKGYYLEEYFKTDREFRLHVSKWGGVFFEVEKIRDNPNDLVIKYENHHNVRNFNRPKEWKQIQDACIKALDSLDLDIAAFDCGYSNGKFVIFESNTGPELLKNTLEKYREQIQNFIDAKL